MCCFTGGHLVSIHLHLADEDTTESKYFREVRIARCSTEEMYFPQHCGFIISVLLIALLTLLVVKL